MMFGFGFLMMLGFILVPVALVGLGIAAVTWLSQPSSKKQR